MRNCTDLPFTKGQLSVIDNILKWPDVWASLYEMALSGQVECDPDFGL